MTDRAEEAELEYAAEHAVLRPGDRGLAAPFYLPMALPIGLGRGFVTITLAYILTQHGVGVAAIGALAALYVVPDIWKFVLGPAIDASLTPKIWYLLFNGLSVVLLLLFGLMPLDGRHLPLIDMMALALGFGLTGGSTALTAAMAYTTPRSQRGRVAGWFQAGNLGGGGLGGGLGLWLTTHAGGQIAAAIGLAAVLLIVMAPMVAMRIAPLHASAPLGTRLATLWRPLVDLARSRDGVVTALAVVVPMGLGCSMSLLAAVSGEWHASADLVALVLGAVGGLANLPGSVAAGYLADLFSRRGVFLSSCLGYGLCLVAMAMAPRTPFAFAAFVLANSVALGAAWCTVGAVIYEQLRGAAAATVNATLSALSNVPVAIVTAWLGQVGEHGGGTAILLAEGWLGIATVTGFAALLWLWRPARRVAAGLA